QIHPGDVAFVTDLIDREVRCAAVNADGTFRIGVPATAGDLVEVDVVPGVADDMNYGTCTRRSGADFPTPTIAQSTFGGGAVPAGGTPTATSCAHCATFQGNSWNAGDPLVAVADGLGLRRQTPELRRFFALGQIGMESADPVNWAPHVFLHPLPLPDNHPRS